MAGGIPVSLLMMHRLADEPSNRKGMALGLMIAAQALACAYYGIFAGLMVGYAACSWRSVAACGGTDGAGSRSCLAPAFQCSACCPSSSPFLDIQEGGFRRTIEDSQRYSANLASYMASSAHAHRWLLELSASVGRWGEVVFPGLVATLLGLAGMWLAGLKPRPADPLHPGATIARPSCCTVRSARCSSGPRSDRRRDFTRPLYHDSAVLVSSRALAVRRGHPAHPGTLCRAGDRATARAAADGGAVIVAVLALLELNTAPFPIAPDPAVPEAVSDAREITAGPVAEVPVLRGPDRLPPSHQLHALLHGTGSRC